ncbi:MAG: CPBP family intramembrane metalloprotease [Phycisphaeraceae bacterium]|nr:CPBP family intramembrane metalloprotease [Phycisphaerales bacterium]MCB9844249.1 CPBP family intramembrane metalloprotease [Phycisphaeraceae bacterium]
MGSGINGCIGRLSVGVAGLVVLSAQALAQDAAPADGAGIVESVTSDAATSASAFDYTILAVQVVLALAAVWIVRSKRLYRPVPGRLTPAEPMPVIPPVMLLVGALVLFLAEFLGAGSAAALLKLKVGEAATFRDSTLAMTGHYAGFAAGLIVLTVMVPHVCKAIGLRFRASDGVRGIGGALVLIPIVIFIATLGALAGDLLNQSTVDRTAHDGLMRFVTSDDPSMRWLFALLVVVAAPIAEETMYRGLIQSAFLRASRSPWTAIVATSVIFTFMHGPVVAWYALPALFVLSLGLGVAAERTKGLLAPMVIHGLFNLLNVGFATLSAP